MSNIQVEVMAEFNSALRAFQSGEGFDSPTHRLRCIHEIMTLREQAEALGCKVMTEDQLISITGDF